MHPTALTRVSQQTDADAMSFGGIRPTYIFLHNEDLNQEKIQDSKKQRTKARTKEKQWIVALSNIADWPGLEAVAEFKSSTGHNCLAKHLHIIGVWAQPTCSLCDLQEEMEKTHLIRCSALQTATETQRYWEARSQLMG
nr:hypothetical protein HmN_000394400 [Hymenolepis microstoma]